MKTDSIQYEAYKHTGNEINSDRLKTLEICYKTANLC